MQGGWRGTEIERPPFVDKYLAGISTRRLDRLRKVRDLGGDPRGNRSGAAGVVDDGAGYFVGGPAVGIGGAGVAGLVGGIVGDFGLVEVGAAGVAFPEDLELLVVFDEEAVDRDVIAVDYEAVCAGV